MKRTRRPASVARHEARARARGPGAAAGVGAAVVTASDTRTRATDESGDALAEGLARAGATVLERSIVHDEIAALTAAIEGAIARGADVVLVTGGTGVAPRDVTPEALRALGVRELPGFGELFRALSFAHIGTPAMVSRATAGTLGRALVFALPGSPDACRLALDRLVLPELHHLLHQLRGPGRPADRGGRDVP